MKRYLGDAVYAEIGDWGDVVLTTENGAGVTNIIFLEPRVFQALVEFVKENKK